jgi:fermentation-respiration switch protein FrsA (DUF1100 family)
MAIRIRQRVLSERALSGGRRVELEFSREGEPGIPALLLLPEHAPAPGAVLLHGYSSRKEHMADNVGVALLGQGIASLAIDLPLHGSRADPLQAQSSRNPLEIARHWRQALADASLGLRYLGARGEIDRDRLAMIGYSLGSFLSVSVAADDPRVRAVVLAAGGDLPTGTPLAMLARAVADPLRAVRRLAGRPLLMVNGRRDQTVRPEQAERLFAAAAEPKTLRWWDAGHYLPSAATTDAARWLAEQLQEIR